MNFFKKNKFKISIFLLTFVFTFILRAHNYEKTPTSTHLDEMLYAWSGLYLIEIGIPVSWSTLEYPKRAEVFKGEINYKGGTPKTSVTLYKPWLDEPPLFSLIVGYFAHINGAEKEDFVPSSFIRIPTVLLASVTSIFIFLIANMVSGWWIGILAMLLYGTIPVFVFASRTALPENLIATLFVIIAYFLLKFYQKPKLRYILPIPVMVGISGLAKPTGFFLILIVIYIVFKKLYENKEIKKALIYIFFLSLALIPFVAAFILYGLYYDSEIFWRVTSIQSFRPVGFKSLAWFFISPAYKTSILVDGWYIFCLVSAVYFLFAPKVGLQRFIGLFFIFWVGVVMITGGEGDLLPWYRFPAFPFMAILGAWGLQFVVQKANLFTSFITVGLLLSSRSLIVNPFRPNITPIFFRLSLISTLLPSVALSIFDKDWLRKLSKLTLIFIISLGIYLNTVYIYNEYEIICENVDCPIVPTTKLSVIHLPIIWRLFVLH